MRILSVGQMDGISNTCRFRNLALENIADKVDVVNTSARVTLWYRIAYHLFLFGIPVKLPDTVGANKKIIELIIKHNYDIVWIDKGNTIEASTLNYIKVKQPNAKLISYSPDNMVLRHNHSKQYLEAISFYDYVITNKSYIVKELKHLGARSVIFVNNTFEPSFHHPYQLNHRDIERLGGEVGFIGAWEKERCESILYLSRNGIKVNVYGDKKWKKYIGDNPCLHIVLNGLFNEDYAKSLCAFKINLCFLRKMNFDKQTTRSVEIPACGGFMLAERTDEHKSLFEEDKEAVFFSSNEELLEKCIYYLEHECERKIIAAAGRKRCLDSDYSNEGMIRKTLIKVLGDGSIG